MTQFLKYLLCTLSMGVGIHQVILSQEPQQLPTFYLGIAFGTSFPIGDFGAEDISNPDAGFAKNGQRFDVYGGYFLDKKAKTTLTGIFRYQRFGTEVEALIEELKNDNPSLEVTGSTENWQVYSFLTGIAHKVGIGSRFAFFPRFGLGPMWITNPGIKVNAPNATVTNIFERNTETGVGLGYEAGIGLTTNLGRHFALMPTFTFSGGFVTIKDVVTTTDNVITTGDYQPTMQSFNIGLSLAYRFY